VGWRNAVNGPVLVPAHGQDGSLADFLIDDADRGDETVGERFGIAHWTPEKEFGCGGRSNAYASPKDLLQGDWANAGKESVTI